MLLVGDAACGIVLNVFLSWCVVNDLCSVWICPSGSIGVYTVALLSLHSAAELVL